MKIDTVQEMQKIAHRLKMGDISEALTFPKYFQIETVRLCNARCPFCAVDQWDKSHPFMEEVLFAKILDELADYAAWIEFIALQRAGEPLLDKHIVQRVGRLKEIGIKTVSLSTNASRLTEDKTRELLGTGLDEIMFSIDSIDKESYQKMRVGLSYEQVIENIETFFRLRDRLRPECRVRVRGVSFYDLDNPEHRRELARWEDFWSRFRREGDRIYMKQAHNWGNQKTWDAVQSYEWVYHPCVLPWSTLHITAMGRIALCPQDYDGKMNLGDVNRNTIAEIWNDESWRRVRRLHESGWRNEISFCRGCRLFDEDFSLEKKSTESRTEAKQTSAAALSAE